MQAPHFDAHPTPAELAVWVMLSLWDDNLRRVRDLLAALPDEAFERPVAEGKNRGRYLIGHLIAEHDEMATILGMGPRRYAEYDAVFLHTSDDGKAPMPDMRELRSAWDELHTPLTSYLHKIDVGAWFGPHTWISNEDFTLQPHRNCYTVLATRVEHFAYHAGQLTLLKPPAHMI